MEPIRPKPLDYAASLTLGVYACGAVVTPICLLLLAKELGFGLAEGGFIEATRGTLIVVALAGSGFAAARLGKPIALGVSVLMLGVGMFLYAAAPTYVAVLLAIVLIGVGSGVIEGLLNPLVQDLHPKDSGRYLNLVNAAWSVGIVVTVLVAGELLTRGESWRWVMGAVGTASVVAGALMLGMRHSAPAAPPAPMASVIGATWRVVRVRGFWPYMAAMACAGGVEGAFTFWSASFIQLQHVAPPRAGGIGTACFAGGMVLGRLAFGWWVPQHRLRRMIVIAALAGAALSVVVPAVGRLEVLYVVLVLAGLSIACFWPSIQSHAAERLPVDSTSLFILLSCGGIPGFSLTPWLMGVIAERAGLGVSFLVTPALFLTLAGVMAFSGGRGRMPPAGRSPSAQ